MSAEMRAITCGSSMSWRDAAQERGQLANKARPIESSYGGRVRPLGRLSLPPPAVCIT